jgi:hypothetical protein
MLKKIAIRTFKIIKNYKLYVKAKAAFRNYKALMKETHPFYNFKVKIVPFQKVSPFEFFDYYSVFYYWVSDFLKDKVKLNILSLGGKIG